MSRSMQAKRFSFRVDDDLLVYLKTRADRNYRTPAAELNAILSQLKADEEGSAKVLKFTPVDGPRGPLDTVSGYRGVYPYGKRWQARISHDGETTRLGVYDDAEEAAQAYDEAARQRAMLGSLNFPREDEKEQLPVQHNQVDEEHWKVITGQGLDLEPGNLPPALRRGLIAAGDTAVPSVEVKFEEPPPDPDVDPD